VKSTPFARSSSAAASSAESESLAVESSRGARRFRILAYTSKVYSPARNTKEENVSGRQEVVIKRLRRFTPPYFEVERFDDMAALPGSIKHRPEKYLRLLRHASGPHYSVNTNLGAGHVGIG
jgi:hypothetical protein